MTRTGAPIMLKAESEGISPRAGSSRGIAAGRPAICRAFHLSFDHWHSTDSPENTQLSQDVYARLKTARSHQPQGGRAVLRPVKACSCRIGYIKGECPNCHSKDQ